MTLRHLKIFVAVCECGGITKAAEALYMAQPAVSTTIAELEKYYKASLFDRINQRLVITELGKELLVKAESILAQFEDFEETAMLGGQNPKLRIGSSLTLGKTILFTAIWTTNPRSLPRMLWTMFLRFRTPKVRAGNHSSCKKIKATPKSLDI